MLKLGILRAPRSRRRARVHPAALGSGANPILRGVTADVERVTRGIGARAAERRRKSRAWSRATEEATAPMEAHEATLPNWRGTELFGMAATHYDLGDVSNVDILHQLNSGTKAILGDLIGGMMAFSPTEVTIAQPKGAMLLVRTRAVAPRPTAGVAMVSLPVVRVWAGGRGPVLLFLVSMKVAGGAR